MTSTLSRLLPLVGLALLVACANEITLDEVESPSTDGYDEENRDGADTTEPSDVAPETDDDGCARFPIPGIDVVVTGTTGTLCDATVDAIAGDVQVQLQRGGVGETCHYYGVFARAGSFDLSVWAPGHASAVQANLVVELDACGDAITQWASVALVAGVEPPPVGLPPADDTSDATPGDTTPGDTTPGDTTPGDTTPGDTTPDDTTPGDTTPDDTAVSDCPAGLVTHEGSVTLSDAADETLDGIECVHGDLTLEGTALTAALTTRVVFVAGDLVVDGTGLQDFDDLAALDEVAGDLLVVDNAQLGSVDIDAISALGGLTVERNDSLTEWRLQGLSTVSGAVQITDNGALERVDLRGLASTDGAFRLESNPSLDRVDGDVLGSVGGDFTLEGGLFSNVDVGELTDVTGSLRLVGDADLDALGGLQSVSSVGGDLTIRDNPSLTSGRVDNWTSGITVGGATLACGNETGDACQ
jgi:hypothetical protein